MDNFCSLPNKITAVAVAAACASYALPNTGKLFSFETSHSASVQLIDIQQNYNNTSKTL